MAMEIIYHIKYKIVFSTPIDYFNIILQKQIDNRVKFNGNENGVIICEFEPNTYNKNTRLTNSDFMIKYNKYFNDYHLFRYSFLSLGNCSDKYFKIKNIYEQIKNDNEYKNISYEEFEFNIDIMLEEFKIFLHNVEFNSDEKKLLIHLF